MPVLFSQLCLFGPGFSQVKRTGGTPNLPISRQMIMVENTIGENLFKLVEKNC